jgi:hypothetical protein
MIGRILFPTPAQHQPELACPIAEMKNGSENQSQTHLILLAF